MQLPNNTELHAIVAEPGGDAEILSRLAARGVDNLRFKVHSDPKHTLLIKDTSMKKTPLFVKNIKECENYDSQTNVPYENYEMVILILKMNRNH